MSAPPPACPECGRPLAADAPHPLCAGCLLAGALAPLPADPGGAGQPAAVLRLGGYELLELLGRGGMGQVWRARQLGAQREVALKVIASGLLATDAERRRFQAEVEAAAPLDHPHIVPVYEVGEAEGRPYFTMKLLPGRTLAALIPDPGASLSSREAATLLARVARAVHFAHERGILHRDLKPGNILLDAAGEPYVADFGLARRLELDSRLTLSGDVLGTPAYLAPEVATGGSHQATIASDLYSLGAILYELLTGQPPFAAESIPALLRKIAEEEPLPPSQAVRARREESPPDPEPGRAELPLRQDRDLARAALPLSLAALPPAPPGRRPRAARFASSRKTGRLIPRDLETICLKCLAK
ncbi:MAG TPA: serine/threonine-protein kinase, partial [Verrucomicrobiota bacterium]|nr:serine/threonine-protein kinase [Verrucomicrobiota bacterium]